MRRACVWLVCCLVVAAGALLTAVGLLLTAQATALWQLYIFYGFLVGVGASVPFILPFAVITRWFERRRGLVLGLVAGGIGMGSLVSPPVTQQMIHAFGWRWTYAIWAGIVFVLLAVSAIFMRRTPKEMGLAAYGGPARGDKADSVAAEGAKFFGGDFDDVAVVGHEAVDRQLDIRGLGVDASGGR